MIKALLLTLAWFTLASCAAHAPETEAEVAVNTAVTTPTVNRGNCLSATWLLTHYDLARLASGSSPAAGTGYPLACCEAHVLEAADRWRCELDWPSSDVVDCSTWTSYHGELSAAFPVGRRSERVTANLRMLAEWAKLGKNCTRH